MSKKRKVPARILSQERLAEDVFDIRLETSLAADVRPGGFVGVYPTGADALLMRPISICDADGEQNVLRLVYRLTGRGTAELAGHRPGEFLWLLGPLGNGYPLDQSGGRRVILMGGGIGIPPLLYTAKRLQTLEGEKAPDKITSILGYRDGQTFLQEAFKECGQVLTATEDGSRGIRGNVLDALSAATEGKTEDGETYPALQGDRDLIFACGPKPMLRAIKSFAEKRDIPAFLSLEERMACGVGVCLGCVCQTTKIDPHSGVKNARVCTEGPVFDSRAIIL